MSIESNPFGGVRLTGADARAFRRQFLGEDIPDHLRVAGELL